MTVAVSGIGFHAVTGHTNLELMHPDKARSESAPIHGDRRLLIPHSAEEDFHRAGHSQQFARNPPVRDPR